MKKKILSLLLALTLVITTINLPQFAIRTKAATLPTYYSSVDEGYTTPVRDQGAYGTCWSFSIMAAVETNLVKQGLADRNLDLSEVALAYFLFHSQLDPLGLTAGDGVKAVHSSWLNEGGFADWGMWMLAMNQGLAYENDAPYKGASDNTKLSGELAYNQTPFEVKNIYWEDIQNEDAIKELVRNYGGVVLSYVMNEKFFDSSRESYYFDGSDFATGHAGLIVGWDDNYSASNFKNTPSRDGAWLIKNSWGENSHGDGYFWMSYDCITQQYGDDWYRRCVAVEMGPKDYDNIYQYDGACGESYVGWNDESANVFRSYTHETLKAVGFALNESDASYTVTVYTNLKDMKDPTSGTQAAKASGTFKQAGYYTVDIDDVDLPANTSYSVVVKAQRGGAVVAVLQEYTSVFPCMDVTAATMEGQSFEYRYGEWQPSEHNNRIKALTADVEGNAVEESKKISSDISYNGITFTYNYLTDSLLLNGYTGNSTELIIPAEVNGSKVVGIQAGAFAEDHRIKKLVAENMDVIGDKAFVNSALEEVELKNIGEIQMMAFSNANLKKVRLESIGHLEYMCLSNNHNLTEIELTGHFGTIESITMSETGIKKIVFPDVDNLFNPFSWGDSIEEIEIAGHVKFLELNISESIGYDGQEANPVTGRYNDIQTKLTSFKISGQVDEAYMPIADMANTLIDGEALGNAIQDVLFEIGTDGLLYNSAHNKLLFVSPDYSGESLVINEPVSAYAFAFLENVKEITLDNVEENSFAKFICLKSLEKLTVNGSGIYTIVGYTPKLTDIYVNDPNAKIILSTNSQKTVDASYCDIFGFNPASVTVHGYAGSCAEEFARIYSFSFENIETGEVTARGTKIDGDYILSDDGTVLLGAMRHSGKEVIPEGVVVIGPGVYSDYDDGSGGGVYTITEYEMPDTVEEIGAYAFHGNYGVKSFRMPAHVKVIGEGAFGYCGYLPNMNLGDSLEVLGDSAFVGTAFPELIIPASITSVINSKTFSDLETKRIVFEGDVTLNSGELGLLGDIQSEPDTIIFKGRVLDVVNGGPAFMPYVFSEVYCAYKDLLYYNMLYYGAPQYTDDAELPNIPDPIDEARYALYWDCTQQYRNLMNEYANNPYTYENINETSKMDINELINGTDGAEYGEQSGDEYFDDQTGDTYDEQPEVWEDDEGDVSGPGALVWIILGVLVAGIGGGVVAVVMKIKKKKETSKK